MGILPSWFEYEDERINGPLLDADAWNQRLTASGFSGIDIVTREAADDRNHTSSMIISTKQIEPQMSQLNVVVILSENASIGAQALSNNVLGNLKKLGLSVELLSPTYAVSKDACGEMPISGKPVISMLEVESPFVADMSSEDFELLKKILLGGLGGLWVSRSNRTLDPLGDPRFSSTVGLLRTLRNEKLEIQMHELALSSQIDLASTEAADLVTRSVKSIFEAESKQVDAETEIGELNGRLYIPRLFDEPVKNKAIELLGKQPEPELQPFSQQDCTIRLEIGIPGLFDTLRWVHDPVTTKLLSEHDVELEVRASGVSYV